MTSSRELEPIGLPRQKAFLINIRCNVDRALPPQTRQQPAVASMATAIGRRSPGCPAARHCHHRASCHARDRAGRIPRHVSTERPMILT